MERTGVRSWGRDRGTQEDLQIGTHIGSRESGVRVKNDYIWGMCREQKQGKIQRAAEARAPCI